MTTSININNIIHSKENIIEEEIPQVNEITETKVINDTINNIIINNGEINSNQDFEKLILNNNDNINNKSEVINVIEESIKHETEIVQTIEKNIIKEADVINIVENHILKEKDEIDKKNEEIENKKIQVIHLKRDASPIIVKDNNLENVPRFKNKIKLNVLKSNSLKKNPNLKLARNITRSQRRKRISLTDEKIEAILSRKKRKKKIIKLLRADKPINIVNNKIKSDDQYNSKDYKIELKMKRGRSQGIDKKENNSKILEKEKKTVKKNLIKPKIKIVYKR